MGTIPRPRVRRAERLTGSIASAAWTLQPTSRTCQPRSAFQIAPAMDGPLAPSWTVRDRRPQPAFRGRHLNNRHCCKRRPNSNSRLDPGLCGRNSSAVYLKPIGRKSLSRRFCSLGNCHRRNRRSRSCSTLRQAPDPRRAVSACCRGQTAPSRLSDSPAWCRRTRPGYRSRYPSIRRGCTRLSSNGFRPRPARYGRMNSQGCSSTALRRTPGRRHV